MQIIIRKHNKLSGIKDLEKYIFLDVENTICLESQIKN